ncbi:MAG: radical SAM protein [Desulfovibrio sp.]|nr:radical SAM protein [Desulfovibrio sp.]
MILRRTQSLCPVCLRRLDATYVYDNQNVALRKTCPDHGSFVVPVWRDAKVQGSAIPAFKIWTRPKSPSYPALPHTEVREGCPFDCGLCPEHGQHTCTGLVEVTLRCDMACPVCYAGAGGMNAPRDPSIADILARLDALQRTSGRCNLQLSGGEPTVREDLPAIIGLSRQHGFGLIQLNTNGLRLAREEGYAETLAQAGLDSVYLQWDGVSDESFRALRGQPCLEFKHHAVEACTRAGLGVVLVATVVRGINERELGDLLRLALRFGPSVRGLHVQPAAFFGRYPWRLAEAPRLTMPDIMAALTNQAPELVRSDHFHPPACEHELCSFSAVYRRTSMDGTPGMEPLGQPAPCCPSVTATAPPPAAEGARAARQFTALHWKGTGKEPALAASLGADSFTRFLAQAGARQRFTLSCMAFQDALSLDVARVRGCCIHVARSDGRLIPFCLHNLTSGDGIRLYGIDT